MKSLWQMTVENEASKLSQLPSSLSIYGEIFRRRHSLNSGGGDNMGDKDHSKHTHSVEEWLGGHISIATESKVFLTFDIGNEEVRKARSRKGSNAQKNRFRGRPKLP